MIDGGRERRKERKREREEQGRGLCRMQGKVSDYVTLLFTTNTNDGPH